MHNIKNATYPMAKAHTQFVCQECGNVSRKWSGKCDACGTWDSISEEQESTQFAIGNKSAVSSGKKLDFFSLEGRSEQAERVISHIAEFDRVLGGGLVTGSAVLIGGDPGIGKSTLLLQAAAKLAMSGTNVAYITGEESIEQVRLRARRLELDKAPVSLLSATSVEDILSSIKSQKNINVVVIDSIQTMFVSSITSAPGTVSQVRAAAHELISFAKKNNITMLLVGHVTKEGQIAGPKVLEHMVDTVLYFEGERGHQFRILRAVKNRFGAANEIGVFEMREEGLHEVNNPSALFLNDHQGNVSGASVFAGMEGTRPVLVEIQALVAPTQMATPRRAVVGWDTNRLAMILAVLQTRYGVPFGDKEVYLNVAGGLRVNEPGADLAVAAALISAVKNTPLPKGCVLFGEVGLSGEVRMVSQPETRLREAAKLGFESAIVPVGVSSKNKTFILNEIRHIRELADVFRGVREVE